ncbi:LpqB family beta-propeller domain-containing protein [Actinokineospora guangxiensis]|uniref:LpqB family beta-propeller domain-containing protein n=1 Tax=Actinokineospora guangxiensis TaxID=1490288 RepID=A0ABW0EXU7_9PSEU
MTRLFPALLAVVLLAGCATIPANTQPKVMVKEDRQPSGGTVAGPARDLDEFSLVRGFIDNAGNIAAARTYLAPEIRDGWLGTEPPIIIDPNYSTPPVVPPTGVAETPDVNVKVIQVNATEVGRLRQEGTYYPTVEAPARSYRFVLKRQPDQQWRIAELPSARVITKTRFTTAYRRVDLQFFDPAQKVLVPDPRWVSELTDGGMEVEVVDMLLKGPSQSLAGAVVSALDGVSLHTNVVLDSDNAVRINLTNLGDKGPEERERMVAQIVRSLSAVTFNKLRILDNDSALVPDRQDWRADDLPAYDVLANPKSDLPGLAVEGRKVVSLRDGKPIEGPTGAGSYDLVSAAQSLDGSHLAVVERAPGGVRLRVGPAGEELQAVSLDRARSLTRPTWTPGSEEGEAGNEVWTVLNETTVVRAVRTTSGWSVLPVNATELVRGGGRVTELRLSRDGVRLAAVVNGQVKVAAIVRTGDSVVVSSPRTLQFDKLRQVVGLDWNERTALVVGTTMAGAAVVSVPLDGFDTTPFQVGNLTLPIKAVAAAPSRPVVVADQVDLWSASSQSSAFLNDPQGSAASVPFYPG